MRIGTLALLAVLSAGLFAAGAVAQPPDDGGEPPRDPEMRQKLLDAFDTNQDGVLDQQERQAVRRAMQEHFGRGGPEGRGRGPEARGPDERRGPEGRRGEGRRDARRGPDGQRRFDDGRGPDGRRGPEGRRGPDGPPPPPNPERLFNAFDEDKDGALSLEEFTKLTEFMRERFRSGPPRGEFGRGPEGRRGRLREGPPGPPPADAPPEDEVSPDESL